MMFKKWLQKSKKLLVCMMTLVLFTTLIYEKNVYAYDYGGVITEIRFGKNDWANNFKAGHPIFRGDNPIRYKLSSNSHGNITKIESHNAKDDFHVQYIYDLNKYRLAILKGDIQIDLYTNSDSWYEEETLSSDDYERPDFEVHYGYNDGAWGLKLEEDSGKGNNGKEFRWSETLPNNLRYVLINFDTEMGGSWGGDGFGANYYDMHLYFEDIRAPKIKGVTSWTDNGVPLGIGKMAYIDVYFDEVVTGVENTTLKLNVRDKNGAPVYANFVSYEEQPWQYKVQYQYLVEEGHYIPADDPHNYLYVNIGDVPSEIRDFGGNTYTYDSNTILTFPSDLKIDGCYPKVNIATPPVNGYQSSYNTVVTVSEEFPGAGLPSQFKYLWSTNSSISKDDPQWNSAYIFANGNTISTPEGMNGTNNYLHIKAWDNTGNVTVKSTNAIYLDPTPPTVEFSTNGSNTLSSTYEVTVDASDEDTGSGIDSNADFKYIWSTEENIPVDSPLWDNASTFKDEFYVSPASGLVGDYYLHVKVWDGANEVVAMTTGTFKIDSKAPDVNFTPNGNPSARADYLAAISVSDDNAISTKKYMWKKKDDIIDPNNFIVWSGEAASITIQATDTGVTESGDYVLVVEATDELGNGTGDYVESEVFTVDFDVETITVNSTPVNDGKYNKSYVVTIDTIGAEDTIHYQWTDSNIAPTAEDENWVEVTGDITYGQDLNCEKYLHLKAISDGINYTSYKTFFIDNTAPNIAYDPTGTSTPVKKASTTITATDNILGRNITLYAKWVLKSSLVEAESEQWDSNMTWDDAVQLDGNVASLEGVTGDYILFIKAVDEAGNEGISHTEAFKLDNEIPTGTIEITTEESTTGYVTVSLDNITDNMSDATNIKYIYSIDGGLNFSKTWIPVSEGFELKLPGNQPSQDINLQMKFMDQAGNESDVISTSKTVTYAPSGIVTWVEYSTTKMTSSPVTAYLKVHGSGTYEIINNYGSDEYVFTDNGTFYFQVRDGEGTVTRTKAIVYYIDNEVLDPDIIYSTKKLTNEDVTVTFVPREEMTINDVNKYSYTFTQNGTFEFNLKDKLGNSKTIEIQIDNIDKEPPTLDVELSNTDPTADPVEATITSNEDIIVLNNLGSKKKIFKESGTFTFKVVDLAGNEASKTVNVNNIDTTPPEVTVSYDEENWTNSNVTATIKSNETIKVLNNGGSKKYEFNTNGLFYFKVSDAVGNVVSVPARVSNIDKNNPVIEFEGNDRLIFVQSSNYAFDDVIVTDDASTDLEDKVQINKGSFNISNVGDYDITYSVTDEAENRTTVIRKASVISPDTFKIFVNGKDVTTGGKVILYEGNINVGIYNASGDIKIKWKEGRVARGLMKSACNLEEDSDFSVNSRGWYTIYVQDQERNTEYFYIYVASME